MTKELAQQKELLSRYSGDLRSKDRDIEQLRGQLDAYRGNIEVIARASTEESLQIFGSEISREKAATRELSNILGQELARGAAIAATLKGSQDDGLRLSGIIKGLEDSNSLLSEKLQQSYAENMRQKAEIDRLHTENMRLTAEIAELKRQLAASRVGTS